MKIGEECIGIREVEEEYFTLIFFKILNLIFFLGFSEKLIYYFLYRYFVWCVLGEGGWWVEGAHFYTGLFSWVISQVNCVFFFNCKLNENNRT